MKVGPAYILLLLLGLTLGVYYPSLSAPLNSLDDQVYVNRLLNEEGFSLSRHFQPQGAPEFYRPLLTLSFELDKHVGGLHERFMHLVNILVHALNVLLVFLLGRRLGEFAGLAAPWLPAVAAMFYAVHPLNTEAVNWIAGRTDLLAGSFTFAALLCLLQALSGRHLAWGGAAGLLLLGGALCKETALFLLPGGTLLLLWRTALPQPDRTRRLFLFGSLLTAAAGYLLLRTWGMPADLGLARTADLAAGLTASAPATAAPAERLAGQAPAFLDGMFVAAKVAGFYAIKLIQPLPLNFAIHRVPAFCLPAGFAVVGLLGCLAWRRRPVGTFYLLSAAFAAPALLVPFVGLTWTPVAERYMYIPAGPFVLATVFGSYSLAARWGQRRALALLGAGGLALAVPATFARNLVWQDNLTLYQDTVRQSPAFAPARYELARALAAHGRQEEADAILLETRGGAEQASSLNRVAALVRQGEYEQARAFLRERAARRDAQEFHALEMLVNINERMVVRTDDRAAQRSHYLEMVAALTRLQELSRNPFYWYRLGRAYLWLGERAEARRCFAEAARRLPPGSPYHAPALKLAEDLAR